ncbi:MAG: hypothetical protein ABI147_00770 [Acidobacteriaceae bacterium]
MLKDQRDLLREFNAQSVRYLVVGGYAFSHYAEPRATKDLDVFIGSSPENAALVFAALVRFGAPLKGVTQKDFADGFSFYQIGVPPSRIDIMQTIEAVDFESAWQAAESGITGDDIPVRYISFDDLVRNKLAVGRLRDLADVEELRQARAATSKPSKRRKP